MSGVHAGGDAKLLIKFAWPNGAFLYFCYTLLYYGLSLYLRSSALCHLGSNTGRRDACLGCDANYVHLTAATRSVWIQGSCC